MLRLWFHWNSVRIFKHTMCFGEQTEAPSVFTFPFPWPHMLLLLRKWPATENELRVGEIGEFYGIAPYQEASCI